MKKIARKIIHYVGVAIKTPFLALFALSYTALYLLQLVSVVVCMAFDEPNIKRPLVNLMVCLRRIADSLEEVVHATDS